MAHSFDAVLNGRTVKFRVQVISTFLIVLYLFNLHPMAICPLILSYTGHLPGDFHVGQTPGDRKAISLDFLRNINRGMTSYAGELITEIAIEIFEPLWEMRVTAPLLRAVEDAGKRHPGHPVTVILPELVEGRWWGYLMHANRERRLRYRLLPYGGPNVVVSSVPWQLRPANPAEAIAQE